MGRPGMIVVGSGQGYQDAGGGASVEWVRGLILETIPNGVSQDDLSSSGRAHFGFDAGAVTGLAALVDFPVAFGRDATRPAESWISRSPFLVIT